MGDMQTLTGILGLVCDEHGVEPLEVLGKPSVSRTIQRCRLWPARREFVLRALATGRWSSADVARFMGRDPGTVRALKKAAIRQLIFVSGERRRDA